MYYMYALSGVLLRSHVLIMFVSVCVAMEVYDSDAELRCLRGQRLVILRVSPEVPLHLSRTPVLALKQLYLSCFVARIVGFIFEYNSYMLMCSCLVTRWASFVFAYISMTLYDIPFQSMKLGLISN